MAHCLAFVAATDTDTNSSHVHLSPQSACWHSDPNQRPASQTVAQQIKTLLAKIVSLPPSLAASPFPSPPPSSPLTTSSSPSTTIVVSHHSSPLSTTTATITASSSFRSSSSVRKNSKERAKAKEQLHTAAATTTTTGSQRETAAAVAAPPLRGSENEKQAQSSASLASDSVIHVSIEEMESMLKEMQQLLHKVKTLHNGLVSTTTTTTTATTTNSTTSHKGL